METNSGIGGLGGSASSDSLGGNMNGTPQKSQGYFARFMPKGLPKLSVFGGGNKNSNAGGNAAGSDAKKKAGSP